MAESLDPATTSSAVARRYGLHASQLFTWRKRFRAQLGLPAPAPGMPAFAALEVAPASLSPEAPGEAGSRPDAATPAGVIEIELGDGRQVRVGSDVNQAALRRVLAALRG